MEESIPFYKILNEICEEKNITQKILSYGWIRELEKENEKHNVIRYQFDLNNATSYKIANDKYATYEILKANNVPIVEHKMIFNPLTRSLYYKNEFLVKVKELFYKNNKKIVIKANTSCEGKDVYFCISEKEIEEAVQKLFEKRKDTLSACEYLEIDYEYRAVCLDEEILCIYKKRKAYVVGNGKDTLKDLIEKENIVNGIEIDIIKDLDLNYIPKDQEEVTVSWKHNLSNGAKPVKIDENDELVKKIKQVAIQAAKALNIRFANIDIAVTNNKKIYVMEVNGNVCMNKFAKEFPNGYKIAKEIYSKAIDKMFQHKF